VNPLPLIAKVYELPLYHGDPLVLTPVTTGSGSITTTQEADPT
jgi:hypothetical protein